MDEHESHFHKNRCDFSPLHIITPFDNFRSILTKYVPSQPILNRLKVLGTECMAVIKENASSQSLLNTAVSYSAQNKKILHLSFIDIIYLVNCELNHVTFFHWKLHIGIDLVAKIYIQFQPVIIY